MSQSNDKFLHAPATNWQQPAEANLVPMVVEQTSRGERAYDIFFPSAERANYFLERTS